MKYIVLDMEWNRPESRAKCIKSPVRLRGEIIQIGAVMLNEDLQEVSSLEIKVKPRFYRKLHRDVQALTSISPQELQNGLPFQETLESRQFSLDYAVYYFELKGSKGHDALNDARDTAAVIRELDLETFIEEEREWRKESATTIA